MANKIKGIKVNGTKYEFDVDAVIGQIEAPNGIKYTLMVDNDGKLYTLDESSVPAKTALSTSSKIYINELYCGGKDANEHTINYCSHNFVEISNLSNKDVNLEGTSLQYAISGTDWAVLPLKGVIKAGSTFLIRGAQCSVMDSPLTKIKVNTYDMEWYTEDGKLITFDANVSGKFYLAYNLEKCPIASPYDSAGTKVDPQAVGYIHLVGIKGSGTCDGFEGSPYSANGGLKNSRLFKRYYNMDGGAKAIKKDNARNNATEWNYVDLTKEDGELIPNIEVYTPKASFEGKTIFFNKTKLSNTKPSMITCSFGIQATDAGNGATRCFNWISKCSDANYIWIRKKGSITWNVANGVESFFVGDNREKYIEEPYNRIIKEYSDHSVIVVNKFIISGLTADEYEYTAGAKNRDNSPNTERCTDIRTFTVRTNSDVNANGIKFVQTTDQQGFLWDEYILWAAAADVIEKEDLDNSIQFMVNTGDMTQNGNRMGEWLDYFNGKNAYLNNMEEMATIGNNDLCHRNLYEYSNADDNDKIWPENITFFFTFELDPENLPKFKGADNIDYFIPSLYSFNYGNTHFMCLNSEIKPKTESGEYGYNFGVDGVFYPQIKKWCENDIEKNKNVWNVAYCHEMPFTILIPAVTAEPTTDRSGGSQLNDNSKDKYWFSEFCQTHDIRLVFGGHKHTQATSWPLVENVTYTPINKTNERKVDSMHPIIVVDENTIKEFNNATTLKEYEGRKYPDSWFEGDSLKTDYANMVKLSSFIFKDNLPESVNYFDKEGLSVNPVVYAMSQASAYKHTSNKELPGRNNPWLRYYFPVDNADKVNPNQKFPFYTIWTITPEKIEGKVRKVFGAFNDSGKFDINADGQYVLKGKCAATGTIGGHDKDIFSINGITSMSNAEAQTDTRTIIIEK